ncbi:MAG TPA: hypothetical protein DER09_06260 [Prolixibacteraceae bacterium]|nr:hypothetical protein [Prolixibacteraceae bacterium]
MKTLDNDKELRKLLKEIQLESPSKDFTLKVMDRVWEEKAAVVKTGQVKSERILGRGFWIIIALFVLLFLAVVLFSNLGTAESGQLSKLAEGFGTSSASERYQSVFSNLGSLPLSIGGILLASSLLVFIDKFLPGITEKLTPHKA